MASATLVQDMIKCLVTGILTFSASLVYTNWRLAPEQNVTLVPLSITFAQSEAACTVDKAKLRNVIARNESSKTGSMPLEPESYESYLKVLSSSPLVLKEFVPTRFLPSLEKDGILTCDQRMSPGAGMVLEAAALLSRPTQYLMLRSCSMLYNNADIPIRASADVKATADGSYEPVALVLRETANLMFAFVDAEASDIARSELAELVKSVGSEDVGLSVKCRVISSGRYSEREIGGQSNQVHARRAAGEQIHR